METQEELKLGIGTKETPTMKPAKVKIIDVKIEVVGKSNAKKVQCVCKHPDKTDPIGISAVKYENKGKLEVSGLWVNKDDDGLLRKGSALALFLQGNNATNIEQLKGKEIDTFLDDKGYLTFKGY